MCATSSILLTRFAQHLLLLVNTVILLALICCPGGAGSGASSSLTPSDDVAGREARSAVTSPFHGGGVGGTRSSGSSSSYPSHQQPPPGGAPSQYMSGGDTLPTSLVRLEVVAILGDLSKPYVALSKTLARTLNAVTAADLVSQLDFPEKNLTWRVRNFFVNEQIQQLPVPLHQVDSGAGSGYGSGDDFDTDEFIDDYYASDDHDSGGGGASGSGSGLGSSSQMPRKRPRRPKVLFGPMLMPKLCQFLSETKAVAIVNLVGDVSSERLLSLVSKQSAVPLIGSSTYASPLTLHEDKEDLYISLSASVRHFARALGHLLVYCHWHSFSVLFDDSPSMIDTQGAWEEVLSQITTRIPRDDYSTSSGGSSSFLTQKPNGSKGGSTEPGHGSGGAIVDSSPATDGDAKGGGGNITDYDYEDGGGGGHFEFEEFPDPILHPNYLTIKTRDSLSAFRALSELTKATQGVIVLLCSERSAMQVFRAAKRLRMLNGDYVFIMVGQFNEFETVPDWIPSGVLALRSPRKAPIGKSLMKTTGKLLASAVTTIKDEPAPPLPVLPSSNGNGNGNNGNGNGNGEYYNGGTIPTGGVFSGFTKHDLSRLGPINKLTPPGSSGSLGLNPFLLPPGSRQPSSNNNNDNGKNPRLMTFGNGGGGNGGISDMSSSPFDSPTQQTEELPPPQTFLSLLESLNNISCWQEKETSEEYQKRKMVSMAITSELRSQMHVLSTLPAGSLGSLPVMTFDILNLVRKSDSETSPASSNGGGSGSGNGHGSSSSSHGSSGSSKPPLEREWSKVGYVSPGKAQVSLETIRWPGGGIFGPGERPSKAYRIVTIVSPPFVMETEAEDNRTCVKGLPCLKVRTKNKDDLALIFADFERRKTSGISYTLACCDGLAMDLLASVARELKFEIDLYLVVDGYFGSRNADGQWNGLMSALISGSAHMSFAPFSVTSVRATAVDFSTPFFYSGVTLLGVSRDRDVPLLAFLAPFSPELWFAIFVTLNLTALVVALYEWFSPFGLNPWGRQRTKNFSISSALWVVWGRLFSHLVAFKAPKSWPNKFLINVWGGFSVIFVASYTANIAALFAGAFFERVVDVNDRSLLSQRVSAVKHSATDFYIKRENPVLWEHIQRFPVHTFQQGVHMLNNGTLDLLIGDGPLLDYYRGTAASCNLIDVSDHDKIGDDTYAVAMTRGFPLKDSISSLLAKYMGNGYVDYLQGKWYGQMHCFRESQQFGARALGVDAVVGMLIMLGIAMLLGVVILIGEHIVYRRFLPYFRSQPKGTLWRSPNLMFFSQKLYRFINCVELVSPHHAAKELFSTLRQGQITSLFQKSVKRKEQEHRRRRKSKAQFYHMIQEIRRVQIAERQLSSQHSDSLDESAGSHSTIYSIQTRMEQHRGSSSGGGPCATLIDRNAPKIVRVLGEGPLAHHSQHHPPPHHHPPLPVPPHHQLATAAAHHHHLPPPPHQEEYAHPHLQQHPSNRSTIFEEQEDILIAEGIHIRNTSGSRASGVLSTGGGIGGDDPISSSSIGTSTAFVDNVYMTTRGAQQQQQKKIKFKRGLIDPGIPPGLCSSTTKLPVTPVHGIFRSPNRDSPDVDDDDVVVIERPCSSASSRGGLVVPGPSTSSQLYAARRVGYQSSRDYEVDETELGEDIAEGPGGGGDGGSDSSYELYSPLDRANLKELSKSQVIAMWRTSEMDLRRQLSQALKARDELAHKLKKPELHDPP